MGRPRGKSKFHLYKRQGNQYWQMWFISDETGKRVRQSTLYSHFEYDKETVQRKIDGLTGTKANVVKFSVDWFEENTIYSLNIEGLSEKTIGLYKDAFRYLRDVYGGHYPILKLDRSMCRNLQGYMKEKGLSNTSINKNLRMLCAAFNRLLCGEVIDRNPLFRFKRLPETERKKAMDRDEAIHFLTEVDNCKHEGAKRLLRIMLFTGLRRGEIWETERRDIDMNSGKYKALNNKRRKNKNQKILRDIPRQVSGDFLYFLLLTDSPFPFQIWKDAGVLSKWMKRLLRQAGLPEDLHLHSLRHTFGTLAAEKTPVRKLQKYFDHSGTSVTEIYLHDIAGETPDIGLE